MKAPGLYTPLTRKVCRNSVNLPLLTILLSILAAVGCTGQASDKPASDRQAREGAVLIGAGDIARCEEPHDEATADLIEDTPGTVFTLGDNAYQRATKADFEECYDPSWGKFKEDQVSLKKIADLSPVAQKIVDRAGW